MAVYQGMLHAKKKAELIEIAEALGVQPDDDEETLSDYLKAELEDMIELKLSENVEVRENPDFIGLWEAIGRRRAPRLVRSASQADGLLEGSPAPSAQETNSIAALSPRRSMTTAANNASSVVRRQSGALVRAVKPKRSLANLKSATSLAVTGAQDKTNSPWAVTALLAGAELVYLAWSAVPWQPQNFGPTEWLTRKATSAYPIDLPTVSVLLHPTFLFPLLRWILISILVPLAIATVFAFPEASRKRSKGPAQPNAVTFNIARAGIAVLAHYIFSSAPDPLRWSFNHVQGFPAIQVLSSVAGTLLTTYQGLRQ